MRAMRVSEAVAVAAAALLLLSGTASGDPVCLSTAEAGNRIQRAGQPAKWLQLAGTLNCGQACSGEGQDPDEETLDFFAAYLMWTDHVNALGGVRIGSADGQQRYYVNITVCDDQGGLAEGVVEELYRGFVCDADPQIDFLLSPYGSTLTRRAQNAVSVAEHAPGTPLAGRECYKPVLLAGGAIADDVLRLPNVFSPLVPASAYVEPVLATLRDAARRQRADSGTDSSVSSYAVLSSEGPFETQIATSLRRWLPVSCYDNNALEQGTGCIKGCEAGCVDGSDAEEEGYCHPTSEILKSKPHLNHSGTVWTPGGHIGNDDVGEGGCGVWDMGYCGGPMCNGSIPLSPYAFEELGGGQADGVVYNSTYVPQKQITGRIYDDLSNIFSICKAGSGGDDDDGEDDDGYCKLDALIAVGHSREFEQYVRVLGTFISDQADDLPKFAVFIGGLRPTARMETNRKNGDRSGNKNVYPYKGWLGTASWHEAMGHNSTGTIVTTEFLGDSAYFQAQIRATKRKYTYFNNDSDVTASHAEAAATLVMLQLALLELDQPNLDPKSVFGGGDNGAMADAFKKVNNHTFYGQIQLNATTGWNQRAGVSAAVVQVLEYDQEPVLVGPPSLRHLGAQPEKLRYNAFCTGCAGKSGPPPAPPPSCVPIPSSADLTAMDGWTRDPRCYTWPQIGICLGLLVLVVVCITNLTKRSGGNKDGGLQRQASAGLRESLLGTGGVGDLLPVASEVAAMWTPRGEQSPPPHEFELVEGDGSGRFSFKKSSSSRTSSVGSTDDLRPSRMFRDRDSKDLSAMRQIGKGSFGVVSEATWRRGGEDRKDLKVAVKELELSANEETPMAKELMRDLLKEFRKEVEICVALDHPNLVKFYGFTQEDPQEQSKGKSRILRLRIIQELMQGGALDHLLYTENWRPRLTQTLKMSRDIAEAMVYLHRIGDVEQQAGKEPIIHRDLKSPNLLLVEYHPEVDFEPVIKITDFGLARQKDVRDTEETESFRASLNGSGAQAARQEARNTQMMTGCGTLYWMAPEVLKGDVYNESVDVYAFAMCVLEMLTGEVPWRSVPAAEVPFKVAIEEKRPEFPALLRHASPGEPEHDLKRLISECWSQNPTERPTFDKILDQVKRLQEATGGPASLAA